MYLKSLKIQGKERSLRGLDCCCSLSIHSYAPGRDWYVGLDGIWSDSDKSVSCVFTYKVILIADTEMYFSCCQYVVLFPCFWDESSGGGSFGKQLTAAHLHSLWTQCGVISIVYIVLYDQLGG